MKPTWNSLQFRIPLIFILSFLLILAAIMVVLSTYGRTYLENQAYKEVAMSGRNIVTELAHRISTADALTRALANLGEQLPPDENLHKQLARELLDYKGMEPFIAGGGLWPAPYQFDPAIERRSFFWGRDAEGSLQYYDDYNNPDGPGYHHEEWYVPAKHLADDHSFWSKSYMDPYSYQPMVTVTAPMYRNDSFYGVSTVDLKLEGLKEYLEQATLAYGGYAFAVDRNGKFLSYPDESLTKLVAADTDGKQTQEFVYVEDLAATQPDFRLLATAVKDAIETTIAKAPQDSNQLSLARSIADDSYQIDKQEARLIAAALHLLNRPTSINDIRPQQLYLEHDLILDEPAFAVVFEMPHTFWKVVTVMPYSRAVAPSQLFYRNLLSSIGGAMLLSLGIALLVVRKLLVKPIARMSDQLHVLSNMADSEYLELKVDSEDELGTLANRFNQRTQKLAATQSELKLAHDKLEQRVAERTAELEKEIRKRVAAQKALIERAERAEKHHHAIVSLALHKQLMDRNLYEAARIINEVAADVVGVSRASIWMMDETNTQFELLDMYTRESQSHQSELFLPMKDYPAYFKALDEDRSIAVVDIFSDPRTVELHTYAIKANIASLLDAPIRIGGKLRGVICLEQCETTREWLDEDIRFIGEIADQFIQVATNLERINSEEKIRQLAFYDPLTELANRRLFMESLRHEVALSHSNDLFGSLIYLDLDNFKTLNDSLGHAIGDELLRQMGARLKSCLRSEDIAARLGGDEFVVLLPGENESREAATDQAMHVARKLQNMITEPYRLKGYEHIITSSFGVTLYPEPNDSATEILKQADTAMYRAKDEGRNRICFYNPAMQEAANRRLILEKELRTAISNKEFEMFYQPLVSRTGGHIGAEALLRWRHPDRNVVMPQEFVAIAEETGLILDIGKWILQEACAFAVETNTQYMAINISPQQFRQPDFVASVKKVLDTNKANPRHLTFEITEGVVIEDIKDTITKINALNDMGIRVAIDDFGTGYSSLAYLKELPLNQLKISNDFIQDINTDINDAVIVETIIAMAQHLELDVVAEGVETEDQLNFLIERGCTIFQGYYFSQPLNRNDYLAFQKKRVAREA